MTAAVIFDVEGTLVNCVPLILESWRRTLLSAGHSFTIKDLQAYSGMDPEWMLERLLPRLEAEVRQKLIEEQGKAYRADFIRQAPPCNGVRPLFEELKGRGVAIGIATTCEAADLEIYDERMRVAEMADAVCCGETVKHGKPDPALLAQCLESLKTGSGDTAVAVGDTPFDAMAGKALGLRCVGLLTGGFPAEILTGAGHDHVFDEVRQVSSLWNAR
jgi:phosphoglycolate phosphatase-like HAD superfamily hydrolase